MKIFDKGRSRLRWIACLAVLTLLGVYGTGAEGVGDPGTEPEGKRPDLITIDAMRTFGKLERPAVAFLHDRHTEALAEKGKDCGACHLKEKDVQGNERMSIKYQRLADTGKKAVMDVYHDNCIQCHTDMSAKKEKSGPLVCGECHAEKTKVESDRQPFGMDRSLHYRHVKASEEKCEQCHHEYDEKAKQLVYAKGKEGTCRYCHMEQTEENRISMRLASHLDCVNCHLEVREKQKAEARKAEAEESTHAEVAQEAVEDAKAPGGPVTCAGCHALEAQKQIEVVKDIPRMKRGQPDVVFVKRELLDPFADPETDSEGPDPNMMKPVPFSHVVHENANDTCRVCHHASLESCVACHTVTGSKDGDFVRLEGAMHQKDSVKSCVGCHKAETKDKACAGCHAFMPEVQLEAAGEACANCHMGPTPEAKGAAVAENAEEADKPAKTKKRKKKDSEQAEEKTVESIEEKMARHELDPVAKSILDARTPTLSTYPEEDIPEIVVIKALAKEYEPAELPHRKIVNALMNNIKDNKMAQYFHTDPGTMCQGCHHNSPVSKKPPRCESCHGKPFDTRYPYKPGLMAAYHNQCMGCHDKMEMEKPAHNDCTACHKAKKK